MMNDDIKINEDYRRVLATANKLETIQSNLESVIDFFLTPIVKLYTKLCNDCLKLLFECEFKLDQFRKAEELVWRRIYHALYRFQKTKRHLIKRQDESLIESHFLAGIGFYSTLIVKLRSHYKIHDAPSVVAPLNLKLGPLDNFYANERLNFEDGVSTDDNDSLCLSGDYNTTIQKKAQDWARQAIYRSLVYLGDLARYLLEISQYDYRQIAAEFYKSASRNQPEHGLPFNQLATLAAGSNHNLDAVCNYMRCCLRPRPFEGAEGNMRKIFDLNRKYHEELRNTGYIATISEVYASKDPSHAAESMVRAVVVSFIRLISDLWSAISIEKLDMSTKDNIIAETKIFFELIRESLELEPIVPLATSTNFEQEFCPISCGSNSLIKPKYLSPTIIYEFCSISIMLISRCHTIQAQRDNVSYEDGIQIIDLVNTLALNLLHYSTAKCQKMIMGKVQELRVVRQEAKSGIVTAGNSNSGRNTVSKVFSDTNLNDSNAMTASNRSIENLNSTSDVASRRAQSRLRQKKAATNYLDSNNRTRTLIAPNEDLDMSELEETALSTIDALDISSDMSEEAADDLINLDSSSGEELILPASLNDDQLGKPRFLRPTKSQNYEIERSVKQMGSSSSLPMPDLITGDISDQSITKVTSQSPLDSLSESEMRDKSTLALLNNSSFNLSEFDSAMKFVYEQTYLPTIKVFCDWLLANGSIIASNLNSFVCFCKELKIMLSLLQDLKKLANYKDGINTNESGMSLNSASIGGTSSDDSVIFLHSFDGPQWVQKYPLSCDFPLFCLEPLKSVHETNIDFNYSRDLTDSEAGFVTIECITAFTNALTAFLDRE